MPARPAGTDEHGSRHEPDQVDPTEQSGRPLMITLVPIGIILALAILVGIFFLAR